MANARTLGLVATASRYLQWTSSVIVLGIVAWFLAHFEHNQHNIYQIVIAALTTAFFLPALALPFSKNYRAYSIPADFIFSYLWLTAFIFAAQDYNWRDCRFHSPNNGGSCTLKKTSEAFIFLAFFFSITTLVSEASLRDGVARETSHHHRVEKVDPARPSADTAV